MAACDLKGLSQDILLTSIHRVVLYFLISIALWMLDPNLYLYAYIAFVVNVLSYVVRLSILQYDYHKDNVLGSFSNVSNILCLEAGKSNDASTCVGLFLFLNQT